VAAAITDGEGSAAATAAHREERARPGLQAVPKENGVGAWPCVQGLLESRDPRGSRCGCCARSAVLAWMCHGLNVLCSTRLPSRKAAYR
jgi:hypothetical protein